MCQYLENYYKKTQHFFIKNNISRADDFVVSSAGWLDNLKNLNIQQLKNIGEK